MAVAFVLHGVLLGGAGRPPWLTVHLLAVAFILHGALLGGAGRPRG
jgi:hypothetical protein